VWVVTVACGSLYSFILSRLECALVVFCGGARLFRRNGTSWQRTQQAGRTEGRRRSRSNCSPPVVTSPFECRPFPLMSSTSSIVTTADGCRRLTARVHGWARAAGMTKAAPTSTRCSSAIYYYYSNNKLDYHRACRPTRGAGNLAVAHGAWRSEAGRPKPFMTWHAKCWRASFSE